MRLRGETRAGRPRHNGHPLLILIDYLIVKASVRSVFCSTS